MRLPVLLCISVFSATAITRAEDKVDLPPGCEASPGSTRSATGKAEVTADRTYFLREPRHCPKDGICPWKRKGYVVRGDVVDEHGVAGDFACVSFRTTDGWLAVDDLHALDEGTRVINFPGGKVLIDMYEDGERVRVADANGDVHEESYCPSGSGTFDQFHSFFESLRLAARSGAPQDVISLVRFPLRVTGPHPRTIKTARELQRDYSDVFTERVLKAIRLSEPAAVFCMDGLAVVSPDPIAVGVRHGRAAVEIVRQ